jgi:hypothetical protein
VDFNGHRDTSGETLAVPSKRRVTIPALLTSSRSHTPLQGAANAAVVVAEMRMAIVPAAPPSVIPELEVKLKIVAAVS